MEITEFAEGECWYGLNPSTYVKTFWLYYLRHLLVIALNMYLRVLCVLCELSVFFLDPSLEHEGDLISERVRLE